MAYDDQQQTIYVLPPRLPFYRKGNTRHGQEERCVMFVAGKLRQALLKRTSVYQIIQMRVF